MIEINVPGKLYLAGEYAVVKTGNYALIVPINRYLTAQISPLPNFKHSRIISDQKELDIDFSNLVSSQTFSPYWLPVGCSLIALKTYLDQQEITPQNFQLVLSSQLIDPRYGKIGLGSSGAVVIATIKAVLALHQVHLTAFQIFNLALKSQVADFNQSSFGDLAVASFQKPILYQKPADLIQPAVIRTFSWPQKLALAIGFTGQPFKTAHGINEFQKISPQRKAFLQKQSNQLTLELYQAFISQQNIIAIFQEIADLYWQFDQENHMGIFTPKLQKLVKIAHNFNLPAKQSGAGGGDCGIAICPSNLKSALLTQWQQVGIIPIENEVL